MISRRDFFKGAGAVAVNTTAISRVGAASLPEAVVVDNVPLDSRRSLYLAGGDWFPGVCLVCCGFLSLTGLFGRWLPGALPKNRDREPCGLGSDLTHGSRNGHGGDYFPVGSDGAAVGTANSKSVVFLL